MTRVDLWEITGLDFDSLYDRHVGPEGNESDKQAMADELATALERTAEGRQVSCMRAAMSEVGRAVRSRAPDFSNPDLPGLDLDRVLSLGNNRLVRLGDATPRQLAERRMVVTDNFDAQRKAAARETVWHDARQHEFALHPECRTVRELVAALAPAPAPT